MELTIFQSVKEPDVFGFTADPTGGNLPPEIAPWRRAGTGTAAQTYAGSGLSDPVVKAVERDGFYLARSGVAIPAKPEPGGNH